MGFFDRFRRRTPLPYDVYPAALLDKWFDQPVYWDIERLSPSEMWATQPHLRTVVSFLCRNVSQLGLHSYIRVSENDRTRDRDSVFAKTMARPNSEMTGPELIFATVGDIALYDVAYWLTALDTDSPSGWAFVRLPPEWVVPVNRDAFRRDGYKVKAPGGDEVNLPVTDVLSFHGYNPTDPREGSSPIMALKGVLQEQMQSSMYRQQVWKNGGRVSAVLTRPPEAPQWSDQARERFRTDWYATFTGTGPRAGGTPILDDGMKLERIDFSAKDSQFVEGTKLSFNTVCSMYHVNPTMVGLLDNANYSNVREFRRALYGDTLGPILSFLESRVNTFLLPRLDMDNSRYYVEFNVAEKLQGNFEEQAQFLQSAVGSPYMTRNEARARLNLPAQEGGDELVTPMNVTEGGQASPQDSGSQNRELGSEPEAASGWNHNVIALKSAATQGHRDRAAATFQELLDETGTGSPISNRRFP